MGTSTDICNVCSAWEAAIAKGSSEVDVHLSSGAAARVVQALAGHEDDVTDMEGGAGHEVKVQTDVLRNWCNHQRQNAWYGGTLRERVYGRVHDPYGITAYLVLAKDDDPMPATDPDTPLLRLLSCFVNLVLDKKMGRVKLVLSGKGRHFEDGDPACSAFGAVRKFFGNVHETPAGLLEIDLLRPESTADHAGVPYLNLQDGLLVDNSDLVFVFVTPDRVEFDRQESYLDSFCACLTKLPMPFFPFSSRFVAENSRSTPWLRLSDTKQQTPVRGDGLRVAFMATPETEELDRGWAMVVHIVEPVTGLSKEQWGPEFGHLGLRHLHRWLTSSHLLSHRHPVTFGMPPRGAEAVAGTKRIVMAGSDADFARTVNALRDANGFELLGEFGPDEPMAIDRAAKTIRVTTNTYYDDIGGVCDRRWDPCEPGAVWVVASDTGDEVSVAVSDFVLFRPFLQRMVRSKIAQGRRVRVVVPVELGLLEEELDLSATAAPGAPLSFVQSNAAADNSGWTVITLAGKDAQKTRNSFPYPGLAYPGPVPLPVPVAIKAPAVAPVATFGDCFDGQRTVYRDADGRITGFLVGARQQDLTLPHRDPKALDTGRLERFAVALARSRTVPYRLRVQLADGPPFADVTDACVSLHIRLATAMPALRDPLPEQPMQSGNASKAEVVGDAGFLISHPDDSAVWQRLYAADYFWDYVPASQQAPEPEQRHGRRRAAAGDGDSRTGWGRWMRPRLE